MLGLVDVMIKIKEHNPIYSQISAPSLVRDILCVNREYWRKGLYRKERREYTKLLIDGKGMFLTGFIDRVDKQLKNECSIERMNYNIKHKTPSLPGVTFREDQLKQMNSALQKYRGVLLAPTGAGKTVLAAGLISSYPKARVLFLVHTIDLVNQAIEEFKRFGFSSVSKMGGGEKDWSGQIIVSSIQTFAKLDADEYCDKFDVVFIDEAHHCSGLPDKKNPWGGYYYRVLSRLLAPVRFGITATLPSDPETKMCLEGLIGPVIDEFTFQEATDLEILAEPKIKLIKVDPFVDREIKTYAATYDAAVVNNRVRNRQIVSVIKELNSKGLSTLTYVQKIEHINKLMDIAERMDIELIAVQGATEGDTRVIIKNDLHQKKIQNVVATVVWREGLNIRSINAIIVAGGGKNEKDLIQACGRGARKDEGKEEFLIVDFIDNCKYLSQHVCSRLGVYVEKGWL